MLRIISIVFIFVSTIPLLSQTQMYETQESGYDVAFKVRAQEDFTHFTFYPGYTYNGRLSAGLGLGTSSTEEYDGGILHIQPYL